MTLAKTAKQIAADPEAQYQALQRSLRRRKGFGLLFVQATPAKASEILQRLQKDLPQKTIGTLVLDQPITNLYNLVAQRPDLAHLNILFIQGIERSLEADIKPGYGGEGDYYNLDTVPLLLSHLNQQRDNFRDHFGHLCFVFMVPPFALKYLIRRAADFLDWRSAIFTFADAHQDIQQPHRVFLTESPQNTEDRFIQASIYFYEGNANYEAGDYQAAIAAYDQALTINPDYHEALNNKGIVLSSLGQYETAITIYDQAFTLKPDFPDPLNNKGNVLSALGQDEAAIAAYDQALALKPDLHEALYNKGIALRNLSQYEAAIACFDAALALNPGLQEALKNKGIALRNLGQYEAAIACYDAALTFNPGDYEALNNKGVTLAHADQYEAALTCFEAALVIKPDSHEAFYHKGSALSDLGQYEAAITCFNATLNIKPDKHKVFNSRGKAYLMLGCQEQAKADFNRAAEMGGCDPMIAALSSIADLRSNQNKEAAYASLSNFIQVISSPELLNKIQQQSTQTRSASSKAQQIKQAQAFAQALGLDPTEIQSQLEKTFDDPEAQLQDLQADLAFERGDYEAAITAYEQALIFKPNHHQALNNKGMALGRLGQYEAAIAAYDAALAIKPDYHEALMGKGGALGSLGQHEAAIACFDAALTIKPDYHEALNNKGVALWYLGQKAEAIACYDAALAIKPDYHGTLNNKACCYALQGDAENALSSLRSAIALDPKYRTMAKTDPDFDPIRTDKRFRALVEGDGGVDG